MESNREDPFRMPPTFEADPNAAEVRSQIHPDRRVRKTIPGMMSFAGTFGAWAISLAVICLVPWYFGWIVGILNGMAIAMLFVVGHDAAHGSLFPSRRMNKSFGRLALLPALHPFTGWVHSHNRVHHAFTNIKEKDSGLPPLTIQEYRDQSGIGRWITRRYRTWYGLGLYYFVHNWWKWEFMPNRERYPKQRREFQFDRLLVVLFAAAWITLLVFAAEWSETSTAGMIVSGFLVPQFAWNYLIAFFIFQQHTHPRIPWYCEKDGPAPSFFNMHIEATPHVHFPGPLRWMIRRIMEHTAHHADPRVPHYELTEAQKDLEKVYRVRMIRPIWTPRMFLNTLKTCRLYDYDNHRWLDYDGTPTTGVLFEKAGCEEPVELVKQT